MSFQQNSAAVRRYKKVMRFGAWLQQLPLRMVPPPFRLLQVGSAFWQSRALYTATTLEIADVLAEDCLDAESIARRVQCDADSLARLLRYLAAIGIFTESAGKRFRNNSVSAHLRRDHPQSVRAMILLHNSAMMSRPWCEQLEQGIRTGKPPFELSHGATLFDQLSQQPDFDSLFSAAMDAVASLTGEAFATDFDWSRFERVIDLGGSRGSKSQVILRHHPALQALVVDRPQVIADAQRYWASQPGVKHDRLQFLASDILQQVPAARDDRDVFLLSAVLHGMDDTTAIQLLRRLAAACGGTAAKIVILELVLAETAVDAASASFDMQMLMGTRGRERTDSEWLRLFAQSGLVRAELVHLQTFACIQVLEASAQQVAPQKDPSLRSSR